MKNDLMEGGRPHPPQINLILIHITNTSKMQMIQHPEGVPEESRIHGFLPPLRGGESFPSLSFLTTLWVVYQYQVKRLYSENALNFPSKRTNFSKPRYNS